MSIRVKIQSNTTRTSVIVPDDQTIRQTLEAADVNYEIGTTWLDGAPLRPGDMDKTYADFGIAEKCTLMNAVKADNAATVKLVGGVAVVSSVATYDQIKKLQKMAPGSLIVYDEDEEPVFAVGVANNLKGSLDNNAAFFGTAKSADGMATITIDLEKDMDKEAFAEKYAGALKNLNLIEAGMEKNLADVQDAFNKILDSIEAA